MSAPVSIRTAGPAADGACESEAARWGVYGDVLACDLDADGHAVTIVAPRAHGPAMALRGALAGATHRGTHELLDQEATA